MNHDQIKHLRSLRLLLSQDKAPLGFLLAAGCPLSVKVAGNPLLPDMAGLSKIINDAHATDATTSPYKKLIEELGKSGRDTSNLEDVLTYIRSMKEVSTGGGIVRGFTENELDDLETEICNTIANAVTKDLPDGDNSYNRRLARWVNSIDRAVPVEVFTTNYDLLLEQALEEQSVPFFDGFSGSRYPFFDIHSVEENELPSYWTRLWKLHGSVNWKTMSGGVCRVSKGIPGSPELIYPSKLKYDQSRKMPFLAMSDRLTSFLLKPHAVLFVCGYSFGDEHINDTIINALKVNQSANVVALMYGKMKKDTTGTLVAPEAVKRALERPNLSIWHDEEAVIGAQRREWSKFVDDKNEFVNFNLKKVDDRVSFGDFAAFTSFLLELIGDHPDADK